MDDPDFQTALAAAFQTPAVGATHRDMTDTILDRVRKTGWARAWVLAGSGLVGATLAAAALTLTQLVEPIAAWGLQVMADMKFHAVPHDPTPFIVIGLTLTVVAVVQSAIRDL